MSCSPIYRVSRKALCKAASICIFIDYWNSSICIPFDVNVCDPSIPVCFCVKDKEFNNPVEGSRETETCWQEGRCQKWAVIGRSMPQWILIIRYSGQVYYFNIIRDHLYSMHVFGIRTKSESMSFAHWQADLKSLVLARVVRNRGSKVDLSADCGSWLWAYLHLSEFIDVTLVTANHNQSNRTLLKTAKQW